MTKPKIIRLLSPASKSQNQHQTTCSDIPSKDRSSLDTIVTNQKTSQIQNYYSLLIDQVKKLSRDNDRMWKLLTQTEEQHSECNKTKSKLLHSLQQAQKELSTIKQLYERQKSNFTQSKIFYENRQKQWQSIVGQLKKVIEIYESTRQIDTKKASQIFQYTEEMKSSIIDQIPGFDHALSIYSKRNNTDLRVENAKITSQLDFVNKAQNDDYGSIYCSTPYKQKNSKNIENYHCNNSTNFKQGSTKFQNLGRQYKSRKFYNEENQSSSSIISNSSRKHRSKLLRSKNFIQRAKSYQASLSTKNIQNVYMQEVTRFDSKKFIESGKNRFHHNPEDLMEILTIEDVFERGLRKTYMKHRLVNEKAADIMGSPHMQKLRSAKSSTRQRLQKTIRKLFEFESQQELDDIIKYIEEKVQKKYHLLKGELVYKFLDEKFRQCEIVFESSNSALQRLDIEPSNLINNVLMNNKLREFENQRRLLRANQNQSKHAIINNGYSLNQVTSKNLYLSPSKSKQGNHFALAINSNIKSFHSNHHFAANSSFAKNQEPEITRQNSYKNRDLSQKNIYTQQRFSRRPVLEQLTKSNSSQKCSQTDKVETNLSDLIGM